MHIHTQAHAHAHTPYTHTTTRKQTTGENFMRTFDQLNQEVLFVSLKRENFLTSLNSLQLTARHPPPDILSSVVGNATFHNNKISNNNKTTEVR